MVRQEKGRGRGSPFSTSMPAKSMDPAARRGGVPVFRRPVLKPRFFRQAASAVAANSPARPAGMRHSPMWMRPFKKVPVVMSTARAR